MLARRTLLATAVFMATFELVSIPFTVPFFALLFAVLFAAGAARYRRHSGTAAPTLLALLFAIELAGLPAYSRTNTFDWITQTTMAAACTAGLLAATTALLQRHRRTIQQPTQTARPL